MENRVRSICRCRAVALKSTTRYLTWILHPTGNLEAGASLPVTIVAVSDGHQVYKMVCDEALASNISVGQSYVFTDCSVGRDVKVLLTNKRTKAFRSSEIKLTLLLEKEAEELIYPPAQKMNLPEIHNSNDHAKLISTEGTITHIRPIRMVRIRGKLIPMGIFFLRKDGAEVKIVRWREANLPVIEFGQNIAISHLKLKLNMYGMELSTTESTQITETEEVTVRVC
ncbi:uncharacterized protein LOC130922266 isoform X1 [Corythoichthys intestinalis]|uniref:uncharacterized protein LOC130922266 isoform X1 n=1 Tax=Corythoichthys intestinalis TaxID=161448 RepID=UPI0025A50F8B|nr:uncharacterized protein LOC130922266 isoform X1 [Corythoichthys intestinalis]